MRDYFDFSSSFVSESLKNFPTYSEFKKQVSTTKEIHLIGELTRNQQLWHLLCRRSSKIGIEIRGYNFEKTTFTMLQYNSNHTPTYEEHYDALKNKTTCSLEEFFNKITEREIYRLKDEFVDNYKKMKILRGDCGEDGYQKILEIHSKFRKNVGSFYQIRRTQQKLKDILIDIIQGIVLYKNENFSYFLEEYNRYVNRIKNELIDYRLSVKPDNTLCYIDNKKIHLWQDGFPVAGITLAISYLFIEFVKDEKNKKLLHSCSECKLIFVSKKADERIKFCPNCSNKNRMSREERRLYMQQYRRREKQEETLIFQQRQISKFIENLGCSEEEAQELFYSDFKSNV